MRLYYRESVNASSVSQACAVLISANIQYDNRVIIGCLVVCVTTKQKTNVDTACSTL